MCYTLLLMLWEVRSELFGPEGIESIMENVTVSGETATVLKGCEEVYLVLFKPCLVTASRFFSVGDLKSGSWMLVLWSLGPALFSLFRFHGSGGLGS